MKKARWRMADIVREHYFDLPVSDQADLLLSLVPVMGRRAEHHS